MQPALTYSPASCSTLGPFAVKNGHHCLRFQAPAVAPARHRLPPKAALRKEPRMMAPAVSPYAPHSPTLYTTARLAPILSGLGSAWRPVSKFGATPTTDGSDECRATANSPPGPRVQLCVLPRFAFSGSVYLPLRFVRLYAVLFSSVLSLSVSGPPCRSVRTLPAGMKRGTTVRYPP